MSRHVIVLDEAEQELAEAEDWYEAQRAGLGLEFRAAVDEAMERLESEPVGETPAPAVPPEVGARRVFVNRFPYAVVFIEVGEETWVLAFAHHHRQPGYWRYRVGRGNAPS